MARSVARRAFDTCLVLGFCAFCLLGASLSAPGCTPEHHPERNSSADTTKVTAQEETETVPDSAAPTVEYPDEERLVERKFDAALRMRLAASAGDDPAPTIQCLLELDGNAEPARIEQLEAIGLSVGSAAGNILTVEGDAAALRRAAAFDFVRSISLSQIRNPLR